MTPSEKYGIVSILSFFVVHQKYHINFCGISRKRGRGKGVPDQGSWSTLDLSRTNPMPTAMIGITRYLTPICEK